MNKYGPKARQMVEKTLHKFKQGDLRSGKSNKKVTDRDQAIAIGLSEARDKGYKTPRGK